MWKESYCSQILKRLVHCQQHQNASKYEHVANQRLTLLPVNIGQALQALKNCQ